MTTGAPLPDPLGAGRPPGEARTVGVDREIRRAMVAAAPPGVGLTGIDRVEVLSNLPDSPGHRPGIPVRRTLLVWWIHGPVPELRLDQVRVAGGVRVDPGVNPVRVLWARRADDLGPDAEGAADSTDAAEGTAEATPEDRALVNRAVLEGDRERVLVVRTSSGGDWSTYVLQVVGPAGGIAPPGVDPPLARAAFSFAVDQPADLDDRPAAAAPPPAESPAADYLARDYDALRARLIDRVATLLPRWSDRSPADPIVTTLELFAGLGDRLASWQDAVATEAYLGTARQRASVRRHARLLDYRMHEGCSARTWLAFDVPPGQPVELPAGTPVADGPPDEAWAGDDPRPPVDDVVRDGGIVFETGHPITLTHDRNRLWLHSWGDPDHVLPVGATVAFLRCPDGVPTLLAGDVLILAAVGSTDRPEDGDPRDRHAVRLARDAVAHEDGLAAPPLTVLELQWVADDALARPLVVARRGDDGRARPAAMAWANVVLADHGAGVVDEALVPERAPLDVPARPRLARTELTWADPLDRAPDSATAALLPDPQRAVPAIVLDDGARRWTPRRDLLDEGPTALAFTVESEADGTSRVRFGDGVAGRRPDPGSSLRAYHRVGGGSAGNVAAGALTTPLAPAGSVLAVGDPRAALRVVNPLPARGGTDPEPVATVRERAARAFRNQQRAVTEADYAQVAGSVPGVRRAVARRRWNGSWYVVDVAVDVTESAAHDPTVWAEVESALAARRMAGVDVVVGGALTVAVEIVMRVHLHPGYPPQEARRLLADAFAAAEGGFFGPGRFTFGQPVRADDVIVTAMGVTGVDWVEVDDEDGEGTLAEPPLRFRRWGGPPPPPEGRDRIEAAPDEVLRADSDPSRLENGRVEVVLAGGA
ncbi:baseplate J/gp47 family protein [Actinomycetospora flava]|uniref:Baseplate J/gp47 family protein n=1 Tax=Actinomycetospora flava TaxID=3129232 RepID=A0ABU8M764_9PSEU